MSESGDKLMRQYTQPLKAVLPNITQESQLPLTSNASSRDDRPHLNLKNRVHRILEGDIDYQESHVTRDAIYQLEEFKEEAD